MGQLCYLCKVVYIIAVVTVLVSTLWGPKQGEEIIFNSAQEVLLVNQNRGITNFNFYCKNN
jgi:hypothetical protein